MLQFKQVQAFYAVMVTGTVTKAAEKLGISQPGVSNLIANFEHFIGFKLFKRIRGKLHPTPEAIRLFNSSEGVIAGFESISRRASALRNLETGKLVVAGLPEMSLEFLPVLINQFLGDKSQVNISFQTRASVKIQQMVSDNLIEVGVTEGPVAYDNLNTELYSYPCYCVIPKNHHLASKKLIQPKDLHKEPLVTLGQGHMTYHRLRDIFTQHGCVWNERCQTRLFSSAMVFTREGVGITFADPFTIRSQKLDDIVIRPFMPIVSYDLMIIWAKDKPLSLIGSSFIDTLKDKMKSAEDYTFS